MNQSEETHTHTHTLTHTHIQPSQVRDPRAFIQTVYNSSVFMVDDLALGPFLSSACSQGARSVYLTRLTPPPQLGTGVPFGTVSAGVFTFPAFGCLSSGASLVC